MRESKGVAGPKPAGLGASQGRENFGLTKPKLFLTDFTLFFFTLFMLVSNYMKKIIPIFCAVVFIFALNVNTIHAQTFSNPLQISAWIPYWTKTDGTKSASDHISYFNELNPFSFEVQPDGTIKDALKLTQSPWTELIQKAKIYNVNIVPTFLWTGPTAMKNVFTDISATNNHINAIIKAAQSINATGVDIDYEGKRMEDKALYAQFMRKLSTALKQKGMTLSCTIEGSSTASPSARLLTLKATSPWSNDLKTLNEVCDVVRVMAYDQMAQTTTSTWNAKDKTFYAPNADISWVRKVLEYNLRYIDKNKLVLGVPTYGWNTKVTKSKKGGYDYEIMKSMSYVDSVQLAKDNNITPHRDATGELSFSYVKDGEQRIVFFSDAYSVQLALEAAKKYNIKGVSLFKLDGKEDFGIWQVLALK